MEAVRVSHLHRLFLLIPEPLCRLARWTRSTLANSPFQPLPP